MLHRHVVDQLLNQNRLADARAAEEADLAALQVRFEQVNNLDSCLEHFQGRRLVLKRRGRPVNRIPLVGLDRSQAIHGFPKHIHHAPQSRTAHRHRNGSSEVDRFHSTHDTFRRRHRHRSNAAFAQVLCHFRDNIDGLRTLKSFASDPHRIMNLRQMMLGKLHVNHRSNDLNNVPDISCLMLRHLWLLISVTGD
jgi:hypothetical protein